MNDSRFKPLLTSTDWNEEWKALQDVRQRSDNAEEWNRRAKTFPVKHGSQHGYVSSFIDLAAIRDGESVFDMGCGTGALATPLAQAGHKVIACDFSTGMLDVMAQDQRNLGISNVEVHQMSWEDDWGSFGIAPDCADVALASRSIATHDLKASLMKLDQVARRRACITLPAGLSPKSDDALLAAAGFSDRVGRDFLYAFNILAACGKKPEVSYIPNTRLELFDSFDDALEGFSEIVRGAVKGLATPDEIDRIPGNLRPWLEANLVQDDCGFHLRKEREVTWAFMAWSTN